MSHLQYFTYPGFGETISGASHYSQAVRVADRIEASGQGGWDPKTGEIPTDLTAEIEQAFANVELALKQAGGKGWSQVYKITAYYTVDEVLGAWKPAAEKWLPDHRPLLTGIGVRALAFPEMRVELEVIAHVEEK